MINLKIEDLQKLNNRIALKSCPFCGQSAKLNNTHTPCYWVACSVCGAELTADIHSYKNEREHNSKKLHQKSALRAIELWNKRYSHPKVK